MLANLPELNPVSDIPWSADQVEVATILISAQAVRNEFKRIQQWTILIGQPIETDSTILCRNIPESLHHAAK